MKKNFKKGFTLIEALIYMALFGLLIGGAVVAAYSIFEGVNRGQTHAMLQEEGNFLLGKVNWAIAGAQSINEPASGTQGSLLSVNKVTGINPTTGALVTDALIIGAGSGVAYINEGAADVPLTNAGVTVSNIRFNYIVATGNGIDPSRIETTLTLTARTANGILVSDDFSTVNYLRH